MMALPAATAVAVAALITRQLQGGATAAARLHAAVADGAAAGLQEERHLDAPQHGRVAGVLQWAAAPQQRASQMQCMLPACGNP